MFKTNLQGFKKNVLVMLTGTSVAQGISLLLIPVIARLFTPADMGAAALFVSLGTIAAMGSTLRYDQAIVLPGEDSIADRLFIISLVSLLATTALVLIIVLVYWFGFPGSPWVNILGIWIFLIPLQVLLIGFSYSLTGLNIRTRQYKVIANAQILRYSVSSGSRVGIGFGLGSSAGGLITGILSGLIVGNGVLYWRLRNTLRNILHTVSFSSLKVTATEYREFPFYATPAVAIRGISENLPILVFSYLFDSAVLGYYAIANRLIQLPVGIICESVRRVFLERASRLSENNDQLKDKLIKATLGMAAIGIIPASLLLMYGSEIFIVLLGDNWAMAGTYAEILAPWLFTIFLAIPSTTIYIVKRKQSLWLKMQVYIVIIRLITMFLVNYISGTPHDILLGYVLVSIVFDLIIMFIGFNLIKAPMNNDNTPVRS